MTVFFKEFLIFLLSTLMFSSCVNLHVTDNEDKTEITNSVIAKGGGVTGQRDAVQLGIARALIQLNPDLQPVMKKGGFLTRDSREKERKKPGLKRARKAPTYTKR